jgi:hypothetical protein
MRRRRGRSGVASRAREHASIVQTGDDASGGRKTASRIGGGDSGKKPVLASGDETQSR